jgi:arginine-tRNA-protein transferase
MPSLPTSPSQSFSHYPAIPPPRPVRLTTLLPHACGYLPGRTARFRAFTAAFMDAGVHERFMDAGFRRAGRLLYQPICSGCRACTPIRVPVERFRPSRSQRRCLKRNADLLVEIAAPRLDDERVELYTRYQLERHREQVPPDRAQLFHFLYDSPVRSIEVCLRDPGRRLLAVGICDVGPNSLSTVYCYYDITQLKRGLGTFSALTEIEHACRLGLPYYYLGYWVPGCAAMEYKRSFRPCEVLGTDGVWRVLED